MCVKNCFLQIIVDLRINETLPMDSRPPNQVEARKRVCEEAGPGKAEDPENREKRVKTRPLTSSPPLVFRGPLETSRRSELLVNVYLFL